MTPDQAASRLAMQGVVVWFVEVDELGPLCVHGTEGSALGWIDDQRDSLLRERARVVPYRAHHEAVASALVAVAEAALAVKVPTADFFNPTIIALDNALEALDAAKAASSSAEGAGT